MSGSSLLLIWACCALVALTFIVAGVMLQRRMADIRQNRIRLSEIATSAQINARLPDLRASDNLRNLFEFPVLFYALVVLVLLLNMKSDVMGYGAWLYVALRYAHSFIHCTSNRVFRRFQVFAASTGVLALLWLIFAIKLAGM